MNAQVLILTGTRQLGWESRPLPSPRPGQVLVESLLSAVTVASELSLIEGRVDLPLPRKIGYHTDSERFRNSYGIFPSGTSTTQCGFRELEEHPVSFWMLRKWTESVSYGFRLNSYQ